MTKTKVITAVADEIRKADAEFAPVPLVGDRLASGGIDAAYAVQQHNIDKGVAAGRRVVGRKIGLLKAASQQRLGATEPDCGALFADMGLIDGEAVPARRVLRPQIEAEIAIVIGRDIERHDVTVTELMSSIEYLLPAIEVPGSRFTGGDLSVLDIVADNASSGMFVLGTRPVAAHAIEPRGVGMTMEIDGTVVSSTSDGYHLPHPYRAALWLARRLAGLGTPLRAGDVVMTGNLGSAVPLTAGAEVMVSLEGLGQVRTSLEA